MNRILIIITAIICSIPLFIHAAPYQYEKRNFNHQIIHIVTINQHVYRAKLARANNGKGRETVPSIAKRNNASIAINAGFFNISGDEKQDGAPSGTLVINGAIYKIKNYKQALVVIQSGKLAITEANPKKLIARNRSIVSGIPLLINHGAIAAKIAEQTSSFYLKRHARTALGVRANDEVVVVVVEQDGLTMSELATLMKSLACEYAINLDGGGSSTLYLNGRTINSTIGDVDEANGLNVIRPVSDAILFVKTD